MKDSCRLLCFLAAFGWFLGAGWPAVGMFAVSGIGALYLEWLDRTHPDPEAAGWEDEE